MSSSNTLNDTALVVVQFSLGCYAVSRFFPPKAVLLCLTYVVVILHHLFLSMNNVRCIFIKTNCQWPCIDSKIESADG